MATLQELFPGNMGRMQMARVILMMRKPEIGRMSPTAPLPPDLERQIRDSIARLKQR